ncbi:MAG: hypothetical protein LiPW39_46 [Parcubacteria group bacterium LiPW_39]|nr:MAG: hypothetical protein LiPW39_46 [Parcubacteria group bacterium LiPW_39]
MIQRQLFRLIIPAHPHKNVFSAVSSRMTSLGPILVATSVNKSFWDLDVEVIDENNYRGPIDKNNLPDHKILQQQRPADFVGFYCGLTSTMPRVYELAIFYQKENAVTIAGGDHAAHLPEEALGNGLDIVVRGEGEFAIVEIIKAIKNGRGLGRIAGISWQNNGKIFHNPPQTLQISDLTDLPYPDFGLLRFARKIVLYPINRTRGCSRRCEFCTVRSQPRWSSPQKMIANIAWLVQARKAKYFFIVDDRLNEDTQGTREFFELIVEAKQRGILSKNLSFVVQIRLEAAREEELLKLMRRAGVSTVCIGYESPIAQELNAMKKGIKPEDMAGYTKIFKRLGFWVHAMFIFGYPSQQVEGKMLMSAKEKMKEFKKFIRKARPDTIQVLLATPVPGTELYERLEKQGRIFPRNLIGWENYDGGHLCFEPDAPMSAVEVQQSVVQIMHWFYSGWNFWKIPLLIFAFPFVVPFSFSLWHRRWRNSLYGYAGYRIIKKWLKSSKRNQWLERLSSAQKKIAINQI